MLNQSVNLADIRAEIEAKIRIELNQKLMAINEYLREHADTFDQMNKIRDKNESMIRKEFTDMEKELQVRFPCLKCTFCRFLSIILLKLVSMAQRLAHRD